MIPERCVPKIGRWAALFLVVAYLGCGSRYDESRCPGNVYPNPKRILEDSAFTGLRYFLGERPGGGAKADQFDYEVWADGKFDFETSLLYHYSRDVNTRTDCPKAVTLHIRFPFNTRKEQMGLRFIELFEGVLHADMRSVKMAYMQSAKDQLLYRPKRFDFGSMVAEVNGVHHVTRGDYLIVGIYDSSYYDLIIHRR